MESRRRNTLFVLSVVAAGLLVVNIIFITGTNSGNAFAIPFFSKASHVQVHSVAVIGDSLVFLSTPELQTQLSAKYPNPDIQAVLGITIDGMRPNIEQIHTAKHPDAVVVALGSNDARYMVNTATPTEAEVQLQNSLAQQGAVLDTLSDTPCVIWVGVQEHNTALNLKVWGPQLNAGFRTNVNQHANAHFLEWESVMSSHSDWQASDDLHFSPAGNAGYATTISSAISDLC